MTPGVGAPCGCSAARCSHSSSSPTPRPERRSAPTRAQRAFARLDAARATSLEEVKTCCLKNLTQLLARLLGSRSLWLTSGFSGAGLSVPVPASAANRCSVLGQQRCTRHDDWLTLGPSESEPGTRPCPGCCSRRLPSLRTILTQPVATSTRRSDSWRHTRVPPSRRRSSRSAPTLRLGSGSQRPPMSSAGGHARRFRTLRPQCPTVTYGLNRTGFLGDLIAWEDGVYGTSKSVFSGGA